jgi:hypothetical protein
MMIKIGSYVRLSEEPSVLGRVVCRGMEGSLWFEVQWENGNYNAHHTTELELA